MEMRALSLPRKSEATLTKSCRTAAGWWGLSAAAERAHTSATFERSRQNVHGAAVRTDSGDVGATNRKPQTCGDMVHARHTKVTSRACMRAGV
eukprot:4631860-Pleurochrysis_carterae.AAC.4